MSYLILQKAAVLIYCMHEAFASHGTYTIPVEGYESKLQVLGQHVEIPETPVKVIKITKTVAVKIPVPYPVKVREKVPYPVHIAKPYPVPVPQIIKVPHVVTIPQKSHQDGGWNSGSDQGSSGAEGSYYGHQQGGDNGGNDVGHTYQVPEQHSFLPISSGQSFGGYDSGHSDSNGYNEASNGFSHEAPGNSYTYGNGDDSGKASFASESDNYDEAINQYLKNHGAGTSGYGGQQH